MEIAFLESGVGDRLGLELGPVTWRSCLQRSVPAIISAVMCVLSHPRAHRALLDQGSFWLQDKPGRGHCCRDFVILCPALFHGSILEFCLPHLFLPSLQGDPKELHPMFLKWVPAPGQSGDVFPWEQCFILCSPQSKEAIILASRWGLVVKQP